MTKKDSEKMSLKRCLPCPCGGRATWGAAFLVCSKSCGRESEYDDPKGFAVRTWNRSVKSTPETK